MGSAAEAADAGRSGKKESLPPFGDENGDLDVPFSISTVAAPGTGNAASPPSHQSATSVQVQFDQAKQPQYGLSILTTLDQDHANEPLNNS